MAIRRWEVRQRLKFIENRLFWEGRVNRSDLTDFFEVSAIQASGDIARYQELAPLNVAYDASRKCYIPTPEFSPILVNPDAESYLAQLVEISKGDGGPVISVVETPQRCIDPNVLRKVLAVMRESLDIQLMYQSMSRPRPTWRWITPHALSSDGRRWHIRAFCHTDGMFKDFLLARIIGLGDTREGSLTSIADIKWNSFVDVIIAPHPGLSPEQKDVIECDYGMAGGKRTISVREALLFYFIKNLGLDCTNAGKPEEQQLTIVNGAEIDRILSGGASRATD